MPKSNVPRRKAGWYPNPDGHTQWWNGREWGPFPPGSEREAARAASVAAAPVQPREPGKSELDNFFVVVGAIVAIAVPPAFIWFVFVDPPKSEHAALCLETVQASYDGVFENPVITEESAGAVARDASGTFDGGTFKCGMPKTSSGLQMNQWLVFGTDGLPVDAGP